jgi:hypothetical protein
MKLHPLISSKSIDRFFTEYALLLLFLIFLMVIMLSAKLPDRYSSIYSFKNSLLLNINVKTNVDCISCEYESKITDTIPFSGNDLDELYSVKNLKLEIPVKYIDCHNQLMNDDLQDMLNVSDHPHILVTVSKFDISKNPQNNGLSDLIININGVEKEYTPAIENYIAGNTLLIKGMIPVNLNDFYISPPSKLMGLVKVNSIIEINFGLLFNIN